MSSITSLTSTPTGLSAVNIHAAWSQERLARGSHRRFGQRHHAGGSRQRLSKIYSAACCSRLEQTVGAQSSAAAPAPGATDPIAGVPATAGTAAPGGTSQSASALLQNYLNNSLQNPAAGGSRAAAAQPKLSLSV